VTTTYTPPPPPRAAPPIPGAPAPQKSSGCWKWGCIGCGAVILVCAAIAAGIAVFVVGTIKSSDIYRGAMVRATSDPRVTEALGSPVEAGWWLKGSVNIKDQGGDADFTFPIHGPKGKADVHAVATREAGKWIYTELTVTPENGPPIDVLKP